MAGKLALTVALLALAISGKVSGEERMAEVPRWNVYEVRLESSRVYSNPFWDVTTTISFASPSGKEHRVEAFWDGGRTWRARFAPDEVGKWTWRSVCSNKSDHGLHGRKGSFKCVPYSGENPLYLHGPLRVSKNRRYLVHADGTPFLWLSDTAWNGVLRAREADWERYLVIRREQGFTAVQFVATQWRGSTADPRGQKAYRGKRHIELNYEFFQRLDPKVSAVNAHGLVAAPVILWALTESDPGRALPETDAIRLARYIVARWGAYNVVWFLGGDGHYTGENARRWHRIGRATFADRHDRLVTMHPCGLSWIAPDFRQEPWFDFIGYQSGHGDAPRHLKWLATGPPATGWQSEPPRPVINLEPNYEGHPAYHSKRPFTAADVRRAAYWSLLNAPTAGVSYGTNPIWVWAYRTRVPEGHASIGPVQVWHHGLRLAGIESMTVLKRVFDGLPWWKLWPAQDCLVAQPGRKEVSRFVAVARTTDGKHLLAYTPKGGTIRIRTETVALPATASWIDPRTGKRRPVRALGRGKTASFQTPDQRDWLLLIAPAGD